MYRNYIKLAVRTFLNQKYFSLINVIGLSIGMTCFIIILLYVMFELSYDRYFKGGENIYRVAIERIYPDKSRHWGRTAFPVAPTFQREYPEIAAGTRLLTNNVDFLISRDEKHIYNDRVLWADPNFFEIFSVPLIKGDPKTALANPNSVVLTSETAYHFFGEEEAVGKTLTINNIEYSVTAVSKKIPRNSHFHFDYLLSLITLPVYEGQQWINAWGAFSYLMLKDNVDAQELEAKLEKMVYKYMAPEIVDEVGVSYEDFVAGGNGYRYYLQPLHSIHLTSNLDQEIEDNGNLTYVYLFSIISAFVLIIACINFMNLTTARSANRATEVGIRKTVGCKRGQLILQFLLESTFLCALGLLAALFLTWLILPTFNTMTNSQLSLSYLGGTYLLPRAFGFILIVGLLAGIYPAFVLSSFPPAAMLKGSVRSGLTGGKLRNVLVIFQFTISIVLIVGTNKLHAQ
jgi:putative ABC transport system permease protein